jgi:hypothetical protein
MIPRAIQSGVSAWDISSAFFSDASNIAGLRELSIVFLFDDNPKGLTSTIRLSVRVGNLITDGISLTPT